MKRLMLFALVCVALCACNSQGKKGEEQATEKQESKEAKVVRKHLPVLREFDYIMNIGTAEIVFTHGDYSIDVEGDSVLVGLVKTDFDSNLLTVSLGTDGNPDYGMYNTASPVKLYISAPAIKCVSLCNAGGFTCADDWKADDIQIGILGKGTMELGNVECNTFLIESSDDGNVYIGNLKANTATLASRGGGEFVINCDVKDFSIINSGKQRIKLTGSIANKMIYNPKDSNLEDNSL